MYLIVWNKETDFFYLKETAPPCPVIYTAPENCKIIAPKCKLKKLNISSEDMLTLLYNSGFSMVYVNDNRVSIHTDMVKYPYQIINPLLWALWIQTKDRVWLEQIRKTELYALCKPQGKEALFATASNDTGNCYIMTFTSRESIPDELQKTYPGFETVRYILSNPYLINMEREVLT